MSRDLKMKQFPVLGMHCAGCAANVEKTSAAVEGVVESNVDLAGGLLSVKYKNNIDENELRTAIRGIGFDLIIADKEEEMMRQKEEAARKEKKRLIFDLGFAWACFITIIALQLIAHSSGKIAESVANNISLIVVVLNFLAYIISGRRYVVSAIKQLVRKVFSMDTLIFFSTTFGVLYSALFVISPSIFPEGKATGGLSMAGPVMILAFVLLGKTLETIATGKTRNAIRALMSLRPGSAHKIMPDGSDKEIALDLVVPGDFLKVLPGGEIPADGVVTEGQGQVNEQMITGESTPAYKYPGSRLYAGTVNGKSATLIMKAESVGRETVLGGIIRTVRSAEATKAPAARLADKVASVFVPTVLILSLVVFVVWMIIGGVSMWNTAFISAVSVLVIACPCALGLATPTAISVSVGKSAREQILIRSAKALERTAEVDVYVFDKTGTLTIGQPKVESADWHVQGDDYKYYSTLLRRIEGFSDHPLSDAIINYVDDPKNASSSAASSSGKVSLSAKLSLEKPVSSALSGIKLGGNISTPGSILMAKRKENVIKESRHNLLKNSTLNVENIPGSGLECKFDNKVYRIGNKDFAVSKNLNISENIEDSQKNVNSKEELKGAIGSKAYFSVDGKLIAEFSILDQIPKQSVEVVNYLREEGKQVVLLTGDRQEEAKRVAEILGVDDYKGGMLPEDKLNYISKLQKEGKVVAMVGDGINDTEAMSMSDVSVAMGGGSDITKEVADVTFMKNDLSLLMKLNFTASKTVRIIRQNLFWALIYNVITIPVAAGVLYPWLHQILAPGVAAAAMACSSIIVVSNSLRLSR